MKQKIGNLIQAICEQESDAAEVGYLTTFVQERVGCFTEYFNSVFKDVVDAEVAIRLRDAGRISQEDFEFRRVRTDSARRSAHDVAIGCCRQLNRLCDKYDVPQFCPNGDDRTEVADFIGKFVYNIYEDGIGPKSLDQAIELAKIKSKNPDKAYNSQQVSVAKFSSPTKDTVKSMESTRTMKTNADMER